MKFTADESAAVLRAADAAAKRLGLRDASDLLVGQGTAWRDLADEFPKRTALSLYSHVKRKCHPGARKGRWKQEETRHLQRLYEKHGPNWKDIAAEIGRTPEACRDRFRAVCGEGKTEVSHDEWSEEELELLRTCKVNGTRVLDIDDPKDISFVKVARRVETRNKQQCVRMWYKLKGDRYFGSLLKYEAHRLELCEKLQKYSTEDDVPWSELGYENVGCGTHYAHDCFRQLKRPYGDHPFPWIVARLIEALREAVEAATLKEWEAQDDR